MDSFHGVTALVTGASKGLGRAYALELARRGANLVLVARSTAALEALAAEVRAAHGVMAEVIAVDLAAPSGPENLVKAVADRGLQVDLLVNNAGSGSAGRFFERPFVQSTRSVALNVGALMELTYLFGREMVARGAGGIINVGSTAGFQPMPYQASYAATKAFVLSFTEAVAEELRGSGVRVMAAHPGATDTGFFDGTTATMDPRVTDSPESVAARTLDDYARGRIASYPGRGVNRLTTLVARVMPRRAVTNAVAALNRKLGLDVVTDLD
ncbi:SDR family oxidoreductase [Lentzea sp. BCCO 10_0061]|uniref:SDR family oxidoreductase n=1 Tax=Lentzea sokolovensis TaxID=3095429 RepID=A0ABU4V7N7_9PSEU|nr:SDR family oxidoreductase [Lentzea sp. BCCO 10_0061]MDX8147377.1 SDR family oxidoreductase [Lentzea sp. BCCO 10_0061]